jgi:hypothetical protein
MKRFMPALLLSMLSVLPLPALAQAKSPDKPGIPVKVLIVFSEYNGEKKISSMPYSFVAITDEKMGGYYSTSLRTGVRIPVETEGKDQKSTYMDVGSNIDCGIRTTDDDHYRVQFIFERSALYPVGDSQDDKVLNSRPPGQPPLVRQFKASEQVLLKDGQTSDSVVSTDPLNGHSLHISITITVLK